MYNKQTLYILVHIFDRFCLLKAIFLLLFTTKTYIKPANILFRNSNTSKTMRML